MKEKLKPLREEIEIPEGIEAAIEGNEIAVKKENKEIKKKLPGVILEKKDNKIIVQTKKSTMKEKKQINTIVSHIKNMLKGIQEDFTYKLQVCSVHFPMTVSVKDGKVGVKNFLGETKERKADIQEGAEVKVEGEIITVSSPNKEAAGQTAANIEKLTRIKDKDRRIFQDGIFMIEKSGKKI
jgi:large subunit ribosomal protein L6